jgi:RecB family endonuclease NucS
MENKIQDYIKHPIIIKNTNNYEEISEKALQKIILDDMENFLNELGEGYCFIKSEYKIKVGDTYNYIDILLFNIKYNCYCVVELKIAKLKKEHIGQIETYMNYIDKEVKSIYHNETIGIIICKENNEYVIKYCSNPIIYQITYLTVNEEIVEYKKTSKISLYLFVSFFFYNFI